MAGVAPHDGPVAGEVGRGVAMATETEVVEARFGANRNATAAAAMATDTRFRTGPIGEVMVALNAVHRAMLVMRKFHDHRLTTMQECFTQGQRRASAHQYEQCEQGAQYDREDQARMAPECESTE